MTLRRQMLACAATLSVMAWVSSFVVETAAEQQGGAQTPAPAPPAPAPGGGRGNFVPEPVPPPQ
ncbi:MAG TPA: hypothetical protein VFS23_38970, partial [Vicinamibacterales bacterium]|nr:hypothetical protein [Vicinamibacterales bacterium]